MRQLKVIQDWGFDHVYLRQESAITRVNAGDHSYINVAKTPVENFDNHQGWFKTNSREIQGQNASMDMWSISARKH